MRLRTPHDLLVRACTPYDFGQHLHTLPEQRPMAHTCPWCIQAHGAYRPMVHTGPWRIQAHGAYRPMVHTGPWCIHAHGAYRPMAHTGPWCIQAHGAYRPMVHTGPWCIHAMGPCACALPWHTISMHLHPLPVHSFSASM